MGSARVTHQLDTILLPIPEEKLHRKGHFTQCHGLTILHNGLPVSTYCKEPSTSPCLI